MRQKSALSARKSNKIFVFVLLILVFCVGVASVFQVAVAENKTQEEIAKEIEDNVDKNLNEIDFSGFGEFDEFLKDNSIYDGGMKGLLNDILKGKFSGGFEEFFNLIAGLLGASVKGFLPLLITIIAIAIVFSIMQSLSSGFMAKSTTEVIHFVCYSAMIILIMSQITMLIATSVASIKNMAKFMEVVFPVMLTLVTALGGIATTATYQPMMTILTVGVSKIISTVVLPCFIATMALSIVGFISTDIKLEKLTKFFKSAGETILGVVFGLFTTFITANGISGAIADNISVKSAKFAISSYVPILGGYLSDGFDLALASVMLVKNALGVGGVIVMLCIVLMPVVKILVFSLGLKLVAGIIEPIGDKRMSEITYTISTNLNLLVVALLGMAFMFFIMMILILLTCNMGV